MLSGRYVAAGLIGLAFVCGCGVGTAVAEEKPAVMTVAPGTQLFTITVKGVERRYFVHVPPSYNDTKKWPVVVMFHGGGGTAKAAMWETGWREKADTEDFLAVFPEGTPPDASRPVRFRDNPQTWNDGSDRPNVGAAQRGVPDVEFVSAMLADLKARFSVAESRIYATGFSNGASMTFRVVRELSTIIAAAAPVAGADWLNDTKPERPVPILYITGTADPLNPVGGGEIHIGSKAFGAKPATQEMIWKWVKMHGCPDEGRVVYDKDRATGIEYGLPGDTSRIVLYTIEGHGHHWPGGNSALPVWLAGKNTAKLNATDVIWTFFNSHPLADNTDAQQGAAVDVDDALHYDRTRSVDDILPILIVVWVICGFIGYVIGSNKNAGGFGFVLGFLLGPIGVVAAALADKRSACPHCGTKLNGQPAICPACETRFQWSGNECTYFPPE